MEKEVVTFWPGQDCWLGDLKSSKLALYRWLPMKNGKQGRIHAAGRWGVDKEGERSYKARDLGLGGLLPCLPD